MRDPIPGQVLENEAVNEESMEAREKRLAEQIKFSIPCGLKNEEEEDITFALFDSKISQQIKVLNERYWYINFGLSKEKYSLIHIEAKTDAYELAKKYNKLPKDKIVTRYFASPVYELGAKVSICGWDPAYNKRSEMSVEMNEIEKQLKAMGIEIINSD